jgi:hypothetical protein
MEGANVLEGAIGRLVSGALWGLGAGLVLTLTRGNDEGLRPLAKSAVKAYLVASDRLREMSGEARETLEDLYAEARAEQSTEETVAVPPEEPRTETRRRSRRA